MVTAVSDSSEGATGEMLRAPSNLRSELEEKNLSY